MRLSDGFAWLVPGQTGFIALDEQRLIGAWSAGQGACLVGDERPGFSVVSKT